jgi:hypothetical protein
MKSAEIMKKSETGCCARFDEKKWDKKTFKWKDKLFVKSRFRSFFHVPLNFGSVMKKACKVVDDADACDPKFILLVDENSLWGADLYSSVTKKVPGMENVKVSGTFMSKVFDGPYYNAGKWAKEMEQYVMSKGKMPLKMFFYYAYCPKCAKHYKGFKTAVVVKVE